MFFYAQLNDDNMCVAVSQLSGEVDLPNMILIDNLGEDYFYRKYENGQWSEEKYIPEPTPEEPTLEDARAIILAEQMGIEVDPEVKTAVTEYLQNRVNTIKEKVQTATVMMSQPT